MMFGVYLCVSMFAFVYVCVGDEYASSDFLMTQHILNPFSIVCSFIFFNSSHYPLIHHYLKFLLCVCVCVCLFAKYRMKWFNYVLTEKLNK